MLQQECEDRIAEIEQDAAVYVEENKKVDASRQSEDIIKVQTERDTFKALYEQLFERMLTWEEQEIEKRTIKSIIHRGKGNRSEIYRCNDSDRGQQ